MTANYRLNDKEIAAFIARGYHILHSDIDADVHRAVREQMRAAFGAGENPGNAVYEQAPAVQQVAGASAGGRGVVEHSRAGLLYGMPSPRPPDQAWPASWWISPGWHAAGAEGLD